MFCGFPYCHVEMKSFTRTKNSLVTRTKNSPAIYTRKNSPIYTRTKNSPIYFPYNIRFTIYNLNNSLRLSEHLPMCQCAHVLMYKRPNVTVAPLTYFPLLLLNSAFQLLYSAFINLSSSVRLSPSPFHQPVSIRHIFSIQWIILVYNTFSSYLLAFSSYFIPLPLHFIT